MLKYIEANPAQWLGYTYWAAGPWWGGSTGSIEPQNGQDLPQTQVMQKYLHH
jgi:endoglucanase